MKDYDLQRGLYALALSGAGDLEGVETAYVFLEAPDRPVMKTFGEEDFEQTRTLLRKTLDELTAGHFFGGPEAVYQPCGDDHCAGCRMLAAQIERAAGEAA